MVIGAFMPIVSATDESDPYFSSVGYLLHCDGPNGSTSIIDSSAYGILTTCFGNAALSTAEARFGPSSFSFDGSDYASATRGSNGLGSGDFTIEFWINPKQQIGSASWGILDTRNGNGQWTPVFLLSGPSTNPVLSVLMAGSTRPMGALTLNSWHHVALVRNSNVVSMYLNGQPAGASFTVAGGYPETALTIGSFVDQRNTSANYHFNGYLDEMRITVGVARYVSIFSPPARPFPDK